MLSLQLTAQVKTLSQAVIKLLDWKPSISTPSLFYFLSFTLTQEDFHGAFQKLLERYNKCIAAGDYFEGDWSFMCVLSIKVTIQKKIWKLIVCSSYSPKHSPRARTDSRSQDKLWQKQRSVARCLRVGILLPEPFRWSDRPIHILGGVLVQPPTGAKFVGCTGKGKRADGYLTSKAVVLKRQSGSVRCVLLPLDPLPVICTSLASGLSAGATTIPLHWYDKVASWLSTDRSAVNIPTMGAKEGLIWGSIGSLKDCLSLVDIWWGMQCGGTRLWQLFPKLRLTSRLKFNMGQKVKHSFSSSAVKPFANFLSPVTFLSLEKNCIRIWWWILLLSTRGATRLVTREDSLTMELSARFGLLELLEFSFILWFARNTLPLHDWAFKAGLVVLYSGIQISPDLRFH